MQPRKRTQFVRFQILTEFSSESCAELCQVFCFRVMSSNFKSAGPVCNGSELCQVFSTSYVKYFVSELCQVFAKYRAGFRRNRNACTHVMLRARVYMCVTHIQKALDSTCSNVGNRGVFLVYIVLNVTSDSVVLIGI